MPEADKPTTDKAPSDHERLTELIGLRRKLAGHLTCSPIMPAGRAPPVMGRSGPIPISELQPTEIDMMGPQRAHLQDLNKTVDHLVSLTMVLMRERGVRWRERTMWATLGAGLALGTLCGLAPLLSVSFAFWRWLAL